MSIARPRSLIARILLAEVAAIAVAALMLPWLTAAVLRHTSRGFQNDILFRQALSLAAALHGDGRGGWSVAMPAGLRATYSTAYDGRAFVVARVDGTAAAASQFAGLAPWRAAPRDAVARSFAAPPYIGVSQPVRAGGTPLWVIVTQDETGPGAIVDDIVASFLPRYSAILLGTLLLLPLVNSLLIARLVISVRLASASAATIGARTLDVRLDRAGLPSEIDPLVRAVNDLLDRLQDGFAQQSQFVGNVAHELRTPLATLRLRLEQVDDPDLRRLLERQCERLAHVVSQLHDLASLELVAHETTSRFDPVALAAELIEERAPKALESGHTIELATPAVPVAISGNRFLIGVALANLLDNAIRHTPAGTAIVVTVGADGALAVRDDGPGFALTGDAAPRRFWRAGQLRSDGAGLGLSIVRRIAEVHDGALEIANAPPHGGLVTIRLGTA